MANPKMILRQGRERSLFYRHPWVFSGAVDEKKSDKPQDGAIVDLADAGGNFLARGYYNSRSNIAVRVLTFENEEIDRGFLERRIRAAAELRSRFLLEADTNAYRLVFAEGDGLPGIVVDKYDKVLVVQLHTCGAEKMKQLVIGALADLLRPDAIYERSDLSVRRQEGLEDMPKGILFGDEPDGPVEVRENGLKFLVDVVNGQKTGFFLDQRENRKACMNYATGRKVLNLFSYTGGFSCYALKAGAQHVTSVDISEGAISLCGKNVALNGFDEPRHEVVCMDVFRYLEDAAGRGEKFDVVIVDPPAFVKSQKDLKNALKAYSKLNGQALRVLGENGILVTSSCSGHVSDEMFRQALFQAALRTHDDLVLLEQRKQPFDHPSRLYFPEGDYLKFLILKK